MQERALFTHGFLLLCCLLLGASPALAGGSPSPETCRDVGKINVRCVKCDTGEYLGMVTVDAVYDAGHNDCMAACTQARDRCSRTYGVDIANTGITFEYWIGLTKIYGHSPTKNCPGVP